MLGITERAGKVLEAVLDRSPRQKENQLVRLVLAGPEGDMRLDARHDGDEVIAFAGRDVLVLDPHSAERCDGRTLDCDGRDFMLR